MSGISFSAPTAWRVSESRASTPMTIVDRLIRTPDPPVHVAVARWPARMRHTAALRCLEARNSSSLLAPWRFPVASISSISTTAAGSVRVGWNTDSPVCTAVRDLSPIRCRAHCNAPMMPCSTRAPPPAIPAAVTAASGAHASSSPQPAAFSWTRTASSHAVTHSLITSSTLVLPPPVIGDRRPPCRPPHPIRSVSSARRFRGRRRSGWAGGCCAAGEPGRIGRIAGSRAGWVTGPSTDGSSRGPR